MSNEKLNKAGLSILWANIKNNFAPKATTYTKREVDVLVSSAASGGSPSDVQDAFDSVFNG